MSVAPTYFWGKQKSARWSHVCKSIYFSIYINKSYNFSIFMALQRWANVKITLFVSDAWHKKKLALYDFPSINWNFTYVLILNKRPYTCVKLKTETSIVIVFGKSLLFITSACHCRNKRFICPRNNYSKQVHRRNTNYYNTNKD